MKCLFFIGHPAHFHLFRNVIDALINKKHKVFILIKKKDILESLLIESGYTYTNVLPDGRADGKIGIAIGIVKKDWELFKFCKKNKPDLMLGSTPEISHIGKLLNIPSIIFSEDDEAIIKNFATITYPFASHIISPKGCNNGKWNNKTIFYNGYHKLAYLHPNRFSPNKEIVKRYFPENKNYYLLRFVNLNAYHDDNAKGFTPDIAHKVISLLSETGDVYISSERKLEPKFEKYQLKINPLDIHHIMYYADIYLGDSQSMAVEAAMLGTPSVRFSNFIDKISVLKDIENNYQLTYGIKPNNQNGLFEKLKELIHLHDLKNIFQIRRMKMLEEKIDVTAFFLWLIEMYPESISIMKENPDYQIRFLSKNKNTPH
ncbi:MAG: DUF354 domain-containing protein [Bacteroidota bacterium]